MVHAPHGALPDYYETEQGRKTFVREVFDETAGDYDRIERLMAFGTGSWYRRRALARSGLAAGMNVLDVGFGTGLVAKEAARIVGEEGRVIGIDPSIGMLRSASRPQGIAVVQGMAESLPFATGRFDFLSMGFALRHMSDLSIVFAEMLRVLAPGGKVCLLEITLPAGRISRSVLKLYMRSFIPLLARFVGGNRKTPRLFQYYWDTIQACVPPERVVEALRQAGFEDAKRFVEAGIFSEYTGRKPS